MKATKQTSLLGLWSQASSSRQPDLPRKQSIENSPKPPPPQQDRNTADVDHAPARDSVEADRSPKRMRSSPNHVKVSPEPFGMQSSVECESRQDSQEDLAEAVPIQPETRSSLLPVEQEHRSETQSPSPDHDHHADMKRQRRPSRRVNYYEERSQSSDDTESQASEDAFVLSDADSSIVSESESSVTQSEEPSTEDDQEEHPDDFKPSANRGPKRKFSPTNAYAPHTPASPIPSTVSRPVEILRPSVSHSHLTKAERRSELEKKRRLENEQAYSFLLDVRDKDMNRPGDLRYDQRTLYIPPSAWTSFTPFEKQFWEIKQNHFDTVLFFQKGKFYELYEDDAMIGHRECDLKLTDRVKMKMVGVPEASFDLFATKLLALGYKVGRVDQCETAVAKGMRVGEKSRGGGSDIVRRELRHVVTSGTIVDGSVLADDFSNYCVSIKESRSSETAAPVFGICTLDASIAEFRMLTFQDDQVLTQLETLLRSLRVREVLLEKGALSMPTLRLIRNVIPANCQITMLKPNTEFLTPEATQARLQSLFPTQELPKGLQEIRDDAMATTALGAMLWYLDQLHLERDLCASGNFAKLQPPAERHALILDAKSLVHLNVLHNDQGTDEGTLHRLLNRCITPFGRRLFTLWLTAPLSDICAIQARLDAVEDLMQNADFSETFLAFARQLPDLERLQTRIAAGKSRPREFLLVLEAYTHFQSTINALLEQAQSFRSTTLQHLLESMPNVTQLAHDLRANFVTNADGSFTPRSNTSETYTRAENAVLQAEQRLEEERKACADQLHLQLKDVPWKHVGTNEIYQVEVPSRTKVPANWIVMSQTKACKRYYTPKGKDLVRLLKEARETRLAALRAFQTDMYNKFRAEYASYARAVRVVAQLDALRSLACSSQALGFPSCRPEFHENQQAFFAFEQLRHPCMAPSVLTDATTEFIPNDLALGNDKEDVTILTGSNMAGKSTTARTAATAIILAQIGCYVPCRSAKLAPIDRIASRMGANDQLFQNNSTFMVEMLEASKILREATPRSLVIMDELGRGTSTFDGQAIAYAVLHHLVARTRCLCYFLTHYSSIAQSLDAYPRVANRHMHVLVDDTTRHVIFTYRLVSGVSESSYGTQVARIAGVPDEICEQAAKISQRFLTEAHNAQSQRQSCQISLETRSDFARLVSIASQSNADATEVAMLLAAARKYIDARS
ncbi:DNA mismatch repair protein msh6 [Malassezia yamatoensis]|uniref:DNA mismatch repair protein n=1 Tax=Malassezia yamatoensis TaxID=253288 RepID=A0AAJ5YW26_9BASI|nr:DNA mismatch repair protein msh6 [Malassezia yamatoensis]